jgi:hypothetical protein
VSVIKLLVLALLRRWWPVVSTTAVCHLFLVDYLSSTTAGIAATRASVVKVTLPISNDQRACGGAGVVVT